jgi:hypothetical protein
MQWAEERKTSCVDRAPAVTLIHHASRSSSTTCLSRHAYHRPHEAARLPSISRAGHWLALIDVQMENDVTSTVL